MHDSDRKQSNAPDLLADIIRAAGPRAAPPTEHYDEVYAAAHAAWQRQLRRRRQRRWLALAASVAVLAVTGAITELRSTGESGPVAEIALARGTVEISDDDGGSWQPLGSAQALVAGMQLRTPMESRVSLTLSEGGSIRLASQTEVVLERSRFELVEGTLYFDSDGRAADASIEIATALGVIEDIGTQFEVTSAQELLRVRVRTGLVSITRVGNARAITAEGGTEIEVPPSGAPVERVFAADDPAWSWIESLAVAPRARSILGYLNWIARETGKQLVWDSGLVRSRAETRVLNRDLEGYSPMEALGVIMETTDFSVTDLGNGRLLIQRTENR